MSAADNRYQALRAHLSYLKLGAAAEALPAALDHATKTRQNHTDFLEALLAAEVDATEARREGPPPVERCPVRAQASQPNPHSRAWSVRAWCTAGCALVGGGGHSARGW